MSSAAAATYRGRNIAGREFGGRCDLPALTLSLSFSVSARLAKPDTGRDGTVVPFRRSGSLRYYVFIVHECCQRRVRRWWVAADCGLRDGLVSFLGEVTIWIWSGSEGSVSTTCVGKYDGIIVLGGCLYQVRWYGLICEIVFA